MKLKQLIILCTILLFSFSVVTANEHYISDVTGLTADGTIPTDGSTVTFTIGLNNTGPGIISGNTNGFRIYSPTGAEWTTTVPDNAGGITSAMYDGGFFINEFSITGSDADTVGFGGFKLFGTGIPIGDIPNAYTVTIGPVDPSFNGGEICIDSSYYPPAGAWAWASPDGERYAVWDGPFCYTIGTPPPPPSIDPIGDKDVNECETLEFTVTVVDTSGAGSIYSLDTLLSSSLTGATFTDNGDNTGLFTWIPDNTQSGTYNIDFLATLVAVADTESITITVNDNDAPTVTAAGPFTALECQEYTFTVQGDDPEGQPLLYSMTNAPAGATIDANTGEFAWTPSFGDNAGSPYSVTFTVEDICGATGNAIVVFNVPVDNAPVFNSTPGPFTGLDEVDEGTLLNFTLDATDPDGSEIIYSTTDPDMPATATLDSATGEFNWTSLSGDAGNYVITFVATDACGQTVSVDVTIDVVASLAPVFTPAGPFTIKECEPLEITLSAVDPDGDDAAIRYSLTNLPVGSTLDSITGIFNWVPATDFVSVDSVVNLDFVATDEVGTETHMIVDVTVENDLAPVINGGATIFQNGNDTTIVECGSVGFVLTAVDPEDILAGIIFENELPEGAIFDHVSGEFSWVPVNGQGDSTYILKIRAFDECNTITSIDVNITVNENAPPVLNAIADKDVDECAGTLTFDVTGTDIESLEFVNESELSGASFNSPTFTWSKPDITDGEFSYIAKFVATDDCGVLSDTLNVNITVNPFPQPPIDAIQNKSVYVCRNIKFNASSSEADVEFGLADIPEGAVFNDEDGEFNWTPEIDQAGTYELKFYSINDCSVSDTELVQLTVKENNPPVFITPGNDTTITDWDFIDSNSIVLYAEDPDGFRITYTATPFPAGGNLIDDATDFNDSGKFVWFFGGAPTGVYDIMFYVEDVCGVMDSVKVTFDIETGIGTKDGLALPGTYYLRQNYPNPFNPHTIIEFGIPEKSQVDLAVYNLLGQKIKTLISESLPANNYVFEWDGTNDNGAKVSSGVYLYKLISDNYTETKKMIMLK